MGYFFAKRKGPESRRFNLLRRLNLRMVVIGAVISTLAILIWFFGFKKPESLFNLARAEKRAEININGLNYGTVKTKSETVGDFLAEQKVILNDKDKIIPSQDVRIYSGSKIYINRARKVSFLDRDQKIGGAVLGMTIGDAIKENNINIGEDDLVSPGFQALAHEEEKIIITRVEIKEEKEIKNIDFKKVTTEDDKLGWRVKKISQAGKLGKKELTFKAVYHNNKLISRKLLGEKVIEKPTEEISVQGTFMKLGKAKTGQASHYAASWGNLNASRDIPRGGFAKVTNLENGKSVVVKINDYGPISPQRIIDLNYASFVHLANDWQGIISRVKVEQILN